MCLFCVTFYEYNPSIIPNDKQAVKVRLIKLIKLYAKQPKKRHKCFAGVCFTNFFVASQIYF